MMMKDDLCQKRRVQGTYTGCPEPGIAECLKIIDIGYTVCQWFSNTQQSRFRTSETVCCRPTEDAFFISGRKRKSRRKWNSIFGQKLK